MNEPPPQTQAGPEQPGPPCPDQISEAIAAGSTAASVLTVRLTRKQAERLAAAARYVYRHVVIAGITPDVGPLLTAYHALESALDARVPGEGENL